MELAGYEEYVYRDRYRLYPGFGEPARKYTALGPYLNVRIGR